MSHTDTQKIAKQKVLLFSSAFGECSVDSVADYIRSASQAPPEEIRARRAAEIAELEKELEAQPV